MDDTRDQSGLRRAEWIETQARDGEATDRERVRWFVHTDGQVAAAAFDDGRAPAFYVVGRPQPYPSLAEARQVLARSH